jgi:hypothetical protein
MEGPGGSVRLGDGVHKIIVEWDRMPGFAVLSETSGGQLKHPFFSSGHAVPRFSLSFATGKRLLRFYSATDNAPIGVNPMGGVFSGNPCT